MYSWIENIWYGQNILMQKLLLPFSWLYRLIIKIRKFIYKRCFSVNHAIPIIVVGNISLGGVGKTPLVIAITEHLKAQNLRVGIVSRGYRAKTNIYPYSVRADDDAELVGDEPLLLVQRTQCPVVIDPQRNRAVDHLIRYHNCQVIVSDDGLQHYKMGRAIEIVVIDGFRKMGNQHCLPAGPLREPMSRLQEADLIVVNEGEYAKAYVMRLQPTNLTSLDRSHFLNTDEIKTKCLAVAAIGNPQRFYSTLQRLGIEFEPRTYPDHYQFKAQDLETSLTFVIMTEKDAVKCKKFANEKLYYLPVDAQVEQSFWDALWSHNQLKGLLSL